MGPPSREDPPGPDRARDPHPAAEPCLQGAAAHQHGAVGRPRSVADGGAPSVGMRDDAAARDRDGAGPLRAVAAHGGPGSRRGHLDATRPLGSEAEVGARRDVQGGVRLGALGGGAPGQDHRGARPRAHVQKRAARGGVDVAQLQAARARRHGHAVPGGRPGVRLAHHDGGGALAPDGGTLRVEALGDPARERYVAFVYPELDGGLARLGRHVRETVTLGLEARLEGARRGTRLVRGVRLGPQGGRAREGQDEDEGGKDEGGKCTHPLAHRRHPEDSSPSGARLGSTAFPRPHAWLPSSSAGMGPPATEPQGTSFS